MSTKIEKPDSQLRRIARFAKHLPDRVAHSWRRQRLVQQLQRIPSMRRVLFVCHGNICRSPYAAAAFALRLPQSLRPHVHIESAGFIGPGRPAPPEAIETGKRRGVDLSGHVSRLVVPATLSSYDLVVVMDRQQFTSLLPHTGPDALIQLGDLDPRPITKRMIIDPFGQPPRVFADSYARIDRCLDALVATVYAVRSQP